MPSALTTSTTIPTYVRMLFRDLFVCETYQYDYVPDWSVQRNTQPYTVQRL